MVSKLRKAKGNGKGRRKAKATHSKRKGVDRCLRLEDMPLEILLHIFGAVERDCDLFKVPQLSLYFARVFEHPILWRERSGHVLETRKEYRQQNNRSRYSWLNFEMLYPSIIFTGGGTIFGRPLYDDDTTNTICWSVPDQIDIARRQVIRHRKAANASQQKVMQKKIRQQTSASSSVDRKPQRHKMKHR